MRNGRAEPGARTRARLAAIIAAASEADAAMVDKRFTARSDGGLVEAEADRDGSVVALRIDARALHRARASEVGAQVVQAVGRAVRAAESTGGELFQRNATATGVPSPPWAVTR